MFNNHGQQQSFHKYNSKFYKIFPNRNFPKFHQVFPRWYFQRFTRIPSKSFPKFKISKISPMFQTSLPTRTFFKNTPNMVHKIFPTNLGRNIPNRISQLKILKLTFKFTNFRFFPTTNFPQKSYQNFTKSSELFPNEKQTFPNELFKFSQTSDHLKIRVEGFPI